MKLSKIAVFILAASLSVTSYATTIVGGSDLLDAAGGAQLETWLGEDSLTFTKIFTHTASFDARGNITDDGKTALDFHSAVDGMGRTITLFRVEAATGFTFSSYGGIGYVVDLPSMVVGGYNPQSWESSRTPDSDYHITTDLSERTGAIFNLTDSLWFPQRQDVPTIGPDGKTINSRGQYQTGNAYYSGPSFGGGADLGAANLNNGWVLPFTYTPGDQNYGPNVLGFSGSSPNIRFDEIEVFTISASTGVPDTGSTFMLGILAWAALTCFMSRPLAHRSHGGR
ncbi:MAG: sorting protein [Verrucomicrobiales bacterium]|nr:sorting protein [Verrucomicrobiales bacterium]